MNDTSEKVKTFFHQYASDFDSLYGHTNKRNMFGKWVDKKFRRVMFLRFEETLKQTSSDEIKTVLDIGCGPGRYCIEFLKQGKRVVALDLAQGMLNIASEAVKNIPSKNIEFVCDDYLVHEFSEKFDAACLMGLFDYIKDPRALVNKLKKDIRKEFYGSFPKKGGLLAWQRQIRYNMRNCPLYLYSKADVEKILDDCGLRGKYTIKDLERDWFVCLKF
jgi:SAM-dependent methyltransferase